MTTKRSYAVAIVGLLLVAGPIEAQRLMENLGRGVIAVRTSSTNVYVGWRMLATDPANAGFNLYRSTGGQAAVRLNGSPLATTTDYVDPSANLTQSNAYFVRAVINGVEQPASAAYTLAANAPTQQYIQIALQVPPGGTDAGGVSYTYSANDGSIGDLDGDGQYEIVLKWDPSDAKDNAQDGYTAPVILDAYKLNGTRLWRINLGRNIRAGAHYTQFMVYDLDGDGKAEVVMKTADGSVDGTGHTIGDGSRNWVNSAGRILTGPEFLTVFDGRTGTALATTNYVPPRGNVGDWGDTYGNRVDRFLAGVAYLDGTRPSVVMARGYYTRCVLAAWDWRNGQLTQRWVFDSNSPGNSGYMGQGDHALSVADVNGDGRDEIVYGSAVVNNNGTGLFTTGFGHGDALHVSRFDLTHPDVLVYTVHEGGTPYAKTVYNARTGNLVTGVDPNLGRDPGRGMIAALDPNYNGAYFWGGGTAGLFNLSGGRVTTVSPTSTNFAMWWDADVLRELEDKTAVTKFNVSNSSTTTLLSCSSCASNNGTKATPVLSGDLFGDWREEVVWRTTDNRYLRIYTTTIPATSRMYTLLEDAQYRLALVWQNVAYNQPPWPSVYIGPGMNAAAQPNITYPVRISGSITGKSGPASARVWTIQVSNAGTAPANTAMIQGISLTQTSGTACTPVVNTTFPVQLGNIGAGGAASGNITINFSACASNAQFTVNVPLSAMESAATSLLTATGQTQ